MWRSVLWVERFLPKPKAMSQDEKSAARRRATFLPLVVVPSVLLPGLLRNRHEFGALLRQNIVVIEQVFLAIAILCGLTIVIAGVVTWHRKTRRGGTI